MTTKTAASIRTGWKFIFWTCVGAVVVALLTNINALPLGPKWEWLRPALAAILGAIGKSLATYAATDNGI